MKKNTLFLLFLFPFIFISCSDDNNTDEPVTPQAKKKIYNFVFNKKYSVTDINYYVGPKGEKTDLSEKDLYDMYPPLWGDIREPFNTQIILDLEKDTISCINEYSQVDYKVQVRTDSVFAYYIGNGVEFYMGLLNKDKTEFTLYYNYSLMELQARPDEGLYGGYLFSKKNDYGIRQYSDCFNPNSTRYSSPESLDKEGDKILWANYKYEFSLIE